MKQLLVEKYRPATIADGYVFQDSRTEELVKKWISEKEFPNILLSGGAGCGKSTLARILINECDIDPSDVKKVNASLTNGIGFIREELEPWMRKICFGKFKVVLLEECDQLSTHAQKSLRDVIESSSDSVRFIMTANHPKQLIDALHSRIQTINMKEVNRDGIIDLIVSIVESEGIVVDDPAVLLQHIDKFAPDIRKIINSIDSSTGADRVLQQPKEHAAAGDIGAWVEYFETCDVVELEKALSLTDGVDPANFEAYYETMYKNSSKFPDEGMAVITISQYLDRAMKSSNQRLHLDAFLYNIFTVD